MRIGFTDYYTIKQRQWTTNPETGKREIKWYGGYALSIYRKTNAQVGLMVAQLRNRPEPIYGNIKNHTDKGDFFPHILIIRPESVQALENEFRRLGIPLPDDRFDKATDWEGVLDYQDDRHPTLVEKLKQRLHRNTR